MEPRLTRRGLHLFITSAFVREDKSFSSRLDYYKKKSWGSDILSDLELPTRLSVGQGIFVPPKGVFSSKKNSYNTHPVESLDTCMKH